MARMGRWPVRTYVYSGILFYMTVLCIGKGIEFIWFVLQESAEITGTTGVVPSNGAWRALRVEGILELARAGASALLKPLAAFIAGVFPMAGALIMAYPLVAIGVVALAAALCFFVIGDFLRDISRRLSGRRRL